MPAGLSPTPVQTSMHAWGAAIDINPAFSDYWLWHRSAGGSTRRM